jgi:pyruvate kinase
MIRQTKIVATIGPASADEGTLRELLKAGVNVCRLNFSHGTHDDHTRVLERLRKLEVELARPVAILQDLCGPKIRTVALPGGQIELKAGEEIILVAGAEDASHPQSPGLPVRIGATYEDLATDSSAGERVLLDDGLIELLILSTNPARREVRCRVIFGGILKERKGINLPDTRLKVPSVTDKDREDLAWGLEHGVDYVALSFVRHEDDLLEVRDACKKAKSPPRIISKIEKPQAVARMEQIIEASDGIMVARGDLGVEMPVYEVPAIQKRLIREAILRDRFVITATQMLESMTEHPRPTRAEVSDVANAIYDGTDAVMLSAETASGKFPVESVRMMARVAETADRVVGEGGTPRYESRIDTSTFSDSICDGANKIATDLGAEVLVTFTKTGRTALFMSRYRPKMPVVAVTDDPRTVRRMSIYRGVEPILVACVERSEELVTATEQEIIRRKIARAGDIAIMVGGSNLSTRGNVNSLKIRRIGSANEG